MITRLTPEQEAIFPTVRDEWLAHGLSTEPADYTAAQRGVRMAYEAAGLPPPRFMIWLGSPWAGVIGQAIAPRVIAEVLGEQGKAGRGQVDGQVRGQVRGQVDGQVDGQVRGQVYGQVRGQVYGQVGGQVYGQVDGQVDGQVRGQVYGQVDGQVDGQVRGQVYGQVRGQVYGQVRGQVDGQVRGQVYGQVDGQVYGQVGGQVYGQVDGQVDGQVRGQVYGQVGGQVYGQVRGQVDGQVDGQVYGQVGGQVYGQVYGQVDGQEWDRFTEWYNPRMAGQHWAGYYSYFDAMERIGVTGLEPIHGQQQVARNAGWWWPFTGFCVITDRPSHLHRDATGALHCENGPAIAYRDGWGFHCWHGRRVPEWVITTPTTARIAAEENEETRRCAIESLGWSRFIEEAGLVPVGHRAGTRHRTAELADARVPDPGNPGQHLVLYDVPEKLWGSRIRLLMCVNGSTERDGTRRRYGLTVPATIEDPLEAAAWTAGMSGDEYALMQRRT